MAAKISVIIPAYNCAAWIGRAIHSVQIQSRPADEILVVDDASTDNLREVVAPPIHYLRHEINRGCSAARNTGARRAAGDYLVFLDADDTLVPDALEKMLQAVETTGASWCITDILRIQDDRTFVLRCNPSNPDPLVAILAADFVMVGIFFRRADFEKLGMYDETLRSRVDWDINIRMIEAGMRFCHVAEPLYRYYRREGSISTGPSEVVLDATRSVLDKHHRRIAPRCEELNRAYAETQWLLGRMHWQANHPFTAMRYAASSVLRARSMEHLWRFFKRIIGQRPAIR